MLNFWYFLVNWLFFWPVRTWLRFRKYLIVFLGFLLIALTLLANYTGDLRIIYRWTLKDVPIYGATKEQEVVIREALETIKSPKVKQAIISIDVTEELSFLSFKVNRRHQHEYHTNTDSYCIDRRMFLKPDRLDKMDAKANVFHEAGHIFAFSLPDWFEKAWQALIGPDDDKEKYRGQRSFPKNGFLSEKGLDMSKEDIAEYSEEAFSYLDNPVKYRGPLVLANSPLQGGYDIRYKLKLHLMYSVEFFTKEQYDKLIVLVEKTTLAEKLTPR